MAVPLNVPLARSRLFSALTAAFGPLKMKEQEERKKAQVLEEEERKTRWAKNIYNYVEQSLNLRERFRMNNENSTSGIFPKKLVISSSTLKSFIGEGGDNRLKMQVVQMLRSWLEQNYESIKVEEEDIVMCQTFPNQDFSPSGGQRLTVVDISARGALLRSSLLEAYLEASAEDITLCLQADADAKVDLKGRFRAELRAKILFGKWTRLARETVDADIHASGKVKIKINLAVKNLRLVNEDNKILIKFALQCGMEGKLHSWKVDQLDPGKCEIRICKIKLGSYVRLAQKNLRKGLEKQMNKWSKFQAPKLVRKLESQMQQKIGEEVSIEIMTVPWTPTKEALGCVLALSCMAFLCCSKL